MRSTEGGNRKGTGREIGKETREIVNGRDGTDRDGVEGQVQHQDGICMWILSVNVNVDGAEVLPEGEMVERDDGACHLAETHVVLGVTHQAMSLLAVLTSVRFVR